MLHFETGMVTLRAAKVGLTKVGGGLRDPNGTEGVGQLEHLTGLSNDVNLIPNLLQYKGSPLSSNKH